MEELFASAALGDENEVAWCDIGLMEGHNLVMMQGLEDLILLQNSLLTLRLIWNNFGHKEVACGIFSALSDDTKTASKGKIKKQIFLFVIIYFYSWLIHGDRQLDSTYKRKNK